MAVHSFRHVPISFDTLQMYKHLYTPPNKMQ
nr:MAG TPA: hypothetical protein [Caudoviricetes sp.]